MRWLNFLLPLVALAALLACRSPVVQITLVNASNQPVSTIIVDYPGGTFGDNVLQPGKRFLYKIKPFEAGPLKLQFIDAQGRRHSLTGPSLHRNQEGSIEITLTQESATAHPDLR